MRLPPGVRSFLFSVRLRLTLWNVLILGMVLIVSGLLLRQLVQQSLVDGVDQELSRRTRPLRERRPPNGFPNGFTAGPFGGPRSGDRSDHRDPRFELTRPRFMDLQGRNYRTKEPERVLLPSVVRHVIRSGETIFTTTHLHMPSETVRIITRPLRVDSTGAVDGIVQAIEPLSDQEREIDLLTRKLLTLIPISLLIAGIGAAFLTDRALRPVRAVTRAASGIGAAKHLSSRLTVKGNDEFSQLAETFNGMVERLEESFNRLEQAYDQQRQFVADASHELRTPLTIIKANTSLALSDPNLDPSYVEVLTEVDRAADRTSRIVQDLFMLARSDSDQLPMDRDIVGLTELLNDVCKESRYFGVTADEPSPMAPVKLRLDADLPLLVEGDRNHLMRLFSNLLDNALRHTPPTGEIVVKVSSDPENAKNVRIAVADTGEGIAPEHLSRICERFYRVDTARARSDGGTGLGLAICQAIVEAHGGSIAFESEVGRGTTVTVTLPKSSYIATAASKVPSIIDRKV